MIKITGKGVYGAIAIGKISVFNRNEVPVKRAHITDVDAEKERFERAKADTLRELGEI